MPDERAHIDQAEHNANFLSNIDKDAYPDWAVTAIFYTALHYLDAFLARKGIVDPGIHVNREEFAKTFNELRRIISPYKRIKDASVRTRYYGDRPAVEEIDALISVPLTHIKTHITKLLKR